MSDQEKVNMFTRATGVEIPRVPRLLTREEVIFTVKMVLSEMQELVDTVTSSPEESLDVMRSCIGVDQSKHTSNTKSTVEKIADQSDAMVDAYYYMLNVAGRNGHNLSRVFDVVHQANMAKIDPTTGKCLRRPSDGKILKPAGWTAPDIVAEIYKLGYKDGQ